MNNKPVRITLDMFHKAVKNGMKVLHIDTETCLGTFCGFQIGSKVSVSYEQILTAPQVMSVQYKWEGDKKAKFLEWKKIRKPTVYDSGFDNSSLLQETSILIENADIILGQNLDGFDMKMLQDGLVNNDLPPMNYEVTLDILKMSRKVFRPLSHKLDARAKKYGFKGKIKMELQDWKDVTFNGKAIKEKMGPYGCRDVEEEQKIFYREFNHYKLPINVQKTILSFLPEYDSKAITSIHSENKISCIYSNKCLGFLQKRGFRATINGLKQIYRCSKCGRGGC